MLVHIAAILAGFVILIWSADRFVAGAAGLANIWKISPLIIGIVIVGFGTSAPEMLVSSMASFNGNPGMGIGNAIGSNITNIALVLGATAMVRKLPVDSRVLRKEMPLVMGASVLAALLLMNDYLNQIDGIILLSSLVLIMTWLIHSAQRNEHANDEYLAGALEEVPDNISLKMAIFWTLFGLLLLMGSSRLLVWGASHVAIALGVSDLIIGLTIVAIGTSLPELAASIASALKGQTNLAVGNIVGSNLFNILGVLALPGLIAPGIVAHEVMTRDIPVMLGLTLLLWIFAIGCWQKKVVGFWKGSILLSLFVAYQVYLYLEVT